MTPTDTSLTQTRKASLGRTRPSDSSRIVTPTAWLPEQPDMSDTIGRKTAMAMTAARVSS